MAINYPKPLGIISLQDIENFNRRIDKTPGFGPGKDCWRFVQDYGRRYGQVALNGRNVGAHRVAFARHRVNGALRRALMGYPQKWDDTVR